MNEFPSVPEEIEVTTEPVGETTREACDPELQELAPAIQQETEKSPDPDPKKKRRGFGTVFLCMLLSLLCGFAGCFGALRFFGYQIFFPNKGTGSTVVYHAVSPIDDSTAGFETFSTGDVASAVAPSVVEITTEQVKTGSYMQQYISKGAGSGVIYSSDGYIITCNHIVSGASTITVTLSNGIECPAILIGADAENDIAVLKINTQFELTPAVIGNSDALIPGETAVVIGNPLGALGGSVACGVISALEREITIDGVTMTLLQTDAALNPGNSGGGMFNSAGHLIGIVNAKSSSESVEGIGFAIPINTVKASAETIISTGADALTGRPGIGVSVIEVSTVEAADYYGVSRFGVYVTEVVKGGSAEAAGLRVGDYILSANDTLILRSSDLVEELTSHEIGDTVTIQVIREERIVAFEVTVQEIYG